VLRILLKKYFLETWPLWFACGLVAIFFPWVRIWTVSQFELSGFAPLIEQFKAFEKFSPVPLSQFLTYEGMIGLTFAEPILLLALLTYAIARGSDVISGELGRGTMEMLLAQPIARLKLVLSHGIICVTGLVGLGVLTWIGIALGLHTNSTLVLQPTTELSIPGTTLSLRNPFEEPQKVMTPLSDLVSSQLYIASTINFFALGFFVFSLSVFMSSWDQYRWRTIGVVIGIYVSQLLLFVLSKSTPRTRFLMPFSFFGAYQPDWMVQTIGQDDTPMFSIVRRTTEATGFIAGFEIGPLGYSLILVGLGLVLYASACVVFCRRDIPAP
jgi:ABC-2 type transport system permease protein